MVTFHIHSGLVRYETVTYMYNTAGTACYYMVMSYNHDGLSFDVILALGFFDYIKNPEPVFRKVAQLKPSKFLASFPKFTPIWGVQRMIRYYWIRKCPVYNYTMKRLERLYQDAPFQNCQIISCERGFFGIATAE